MGKKNRHNKQYKKTPADVKNYQNFINNSTDSPDSTIPVNNEYLQGSAELNSFDEELNTTSNIKKTPLKYRFMDWLKNNIFPTIITTIVIAIATATITHQVNIAVINQKIEYLETQVQQLKDGTVEKELLNSKLSEIEIKIKSSHSLELNDIKWQLKQLEDDVKELLK